MQMADKSLPAVSLGGKSSDSSWLNQYSSTGFASRIVSIWNSFPNWVVSANTTNTFKNRFDRFWQNQEIINDTDVLGT